MAKAPVPNASTGKGPSITKKASTKDGGVNSEDKLKALVAAYNAKKGSMSPEQRKKVEARIKALKQGMGKKGVLKGA